MDAHTADGDDMTAEEIKELLKDCLDVRISFRYGRVQVQLLLDGYVIATSKVFVPVERIIE